MTSYTSDDYQEDDISEDESHSQNQEESTLDLSSEQSHYDNIPGIDPFLDLDPYIPDRDYAEFVIRTAKKTVKQEDSLVRQIFYTGISKDSANPTNLAIMAPTSEGKTHPVLETLNYFPKKDIWKVGSMSPKVIIRQNGTLVDGNNQPVEEKIKELRKQIGSCKDKDRNEDLKQQLYQIYQEAKVLIDLQGLLLVFLEPPHPETWTILKPLLSHDDFEIEHPYVYEVESMGFKVKKVVTRGWPACIFCSAKNESNWPAWPEIASRFLITSPTMIREKYLDGNRLIAQRMGLPKLLQQTLVVSDGDVELAKKCTSYVIQQVKNLTENTRGNNIIWIPFGQILAEILPSEKGTDNRLTKRIFSFLIIITLSRAHLRSRLHYGNERLVIANIREDLHEVLHITQNLSAIPPYKLKIFKEIFLPLYKSKHYPDKSIDDNEKQERIIAVTTRELCDYYKEKSGKFITTNNLKQIYLNEFINIGLVDEEDSILDKRQKIYYPLLDLDPSANSDDDESTKKMKKLSISNRMDNISDHSSLLMPKNCIDIPENWLELEIIELLKCPSKLTKFELYNESNEQICICKFISEYQKDSAFNGYFSKPLFSNYYSKAFGNMSYVGKFIDDGSKKLSIAYQMDKFSISDKAKFALTRKPPIVSIEEFFRDHPDSPYTPLTEHTYEQSPCYFIIEEIRGFFHCRVHPDIESVHLESVEHHCKYSEPGLHKSELLRLLSSTDGKDSMLKERKTAIELDVLTKQIE